jgi:hypothetical protein
MAATEDGLIQEVFRVALAAPTQPAPSSGPQVAVLEILAQVGLSERNAPVLWPCVHGQT